MVAVKSEPRLAVSNPVEQDSGSLESPSEFNRFDASENIAGEGLLGGSSPGEILGNRLAAAGADNFQDLMGTGGSETGTPGTGLGRSSSLQGASHFSDPAGTGGIGQFSRDQGANNYRDPERLGALAGRDIFREGMLNSREMGMGETGAAANGAQAAAGGANEADVNKFKRMVSPLYVNNSDLAHLAIAGRSADLSLVSMFDVAEAYSGTFTSIASDLNHLRASEGFSTDASLRSTAVELIDVEAKRVGLVISAAPTAGEAIRDLRGIQRAITRGASGSDLEPLIDRATDSLEIMEHELAARLNESNFTRQREQRERSRASSSSQVPPGYGNH